MGWIPKDLIVIFQTYQLKKNLREIHRIITEWVNKINSFFFKNIWCKRNESLIEWEKKNNINFIEKRKKNGNKKSIKERAKRKISGKRILYYHVVDETFYNKVKIRIGMDFLSSQDKKVIFWCIFVRRF